MSKITGLGKLDRERIGRLLRGTRHTISVAEATKILGIPQPYAAKLLARWASKGWLARVKRGIYVAVPLEATSNDIVLEDPFIIAEKLYAPCYIGGWSAAEHWGLTEQIFRVLIVFTLQKKHDLQPNIKGSEFLLTKIPASCLFGLKSIWRGQIKVSISDPSRTIIDLLNNPKLGGGIRPVTDIFCNYLKSEYKNTKQLIEYAEKLNNGAVYKRLGFLLEHYAPEETQLIKICKKSITRGNSRLDPQLEKTNLVTRWHLWLPKNWANK